MTEVEVPVPGPGQIRVRLSAVSLNYLDLKVIAGHFPGGRSGLVPLSDAAGTVSAVGPGVDRWSVGDRVCSLFFPCWQAGAITSEARADIPGSTRDGMLQDEVLFSETGVVAAPSTLDLTQAATLPCAALTAWQLFTGPRPLMPGEIVLVQGSGGVSLFALQFARAAGARVITTSGSPEKAERLRNLGAETVIDYRATPDWGNAVRAATSGHGADHIIEIGEPGTLEQSISAAAVNAQVLLIGRPVDGPAIDPAKLMAAMATYRRISVGSRADFAAMSRAIDANQIQPVIDRIFGPNEVLVALRHFATRGHFGKVVIRLTDE